MQLLQYNHVFAQLISMPHFNNINFYQNRPKIKLILQNAILGALGALPPDPRNSPTLLHISGYTPGW